MTTPFEAALRLSLTTLWDTWEGPMQPRASKRKKRAPLAPTGRTAVRPRETVVQDAPAAAAGDLCVLCLRKQTSVAFYTLRACGETPERVVQPYRNVIGVPGEYALGACLAVSPRRFEGLSGPFVRHERHHYAYEVDPARRPPARSTGASSTTASGACSTAPSSRTGTS
jgi:hypothetical protein